MWIIENTISINFQQSDDEDDDDVDEVDVWKQLRDWFSAATFGNKHNTNEQIRS